MSGKSGDQRRHSSSGSWPYLKFYHKTVAFIEAEMPDAERESLLAWYTKCVSYRPIRCY